MDVSISDRNFKHIRRKVESGRYSSADDVLMKALALLDERDAELERELADMHERVRRGTEQADGGQLISSTRVFGELRQRNAALFKPEA